MRVRVAAVAMGLVAMAAACGDGQVTETSTGAAVRYVDVDGRTNRFNSSFLAYFPAQITVRPGDVVVFRSVWTGEPHTVTMGASAERALTPRSGVALPQWTLGSSHRLPANVARPCYLDTGSPPTDPTQSCPVVERPAFNGRQTYFSSGFLPEDAHFRVEVARNTGPGSYRFFCSFHGPKMSGVMRVVRPRDEIPSQSEVDAEASERLSAFVDETLDDHERAYEPYERARAGRFPWPSLASFETRGGLVKVLEFVPYTLKAKVNERVRWSLLGAHTIAFGAPDSAKPPAVRILTTGETEIKADAVNESRAPEPPVGAPRSPVTLEAGPYEDGFLSSGVLYSPRRGLVTFVVRFSDAGSYRYECLLHPRMTGLVIVST